MLPSSFLRFCLLFFFLTAGCTGTPAEQVAQIPTQVILPTMIPSEVFTPTPEPTLIPSSTPSVTTAPTVEPTLTFTVTPDRMLTQAAEINATNIVLMQTLSVVQTISIATYTLTPSRTPIPPTSTITPTITPSLTDDPVISLPPSLYYGRESVQLRTCASRMCEMIARVGAGMPVMVTGRINGEAVNAGNDQWYRVDYQGRQLFGYSGSLSAQPPRQPTTAPVTRPLVTSPGFVSPMQTCPGLSFTCSMLTCEQARACLAAGNNSLDQDEDRIPCESICTDGSPVLVAPPQTQTCPGLTATCGSLTCEQAYACLAAGNDSLDQNNNGVPCESICGG